MAADSHEFHCHGARDRSPTARVSSYVACTIIHSGWFLSSQQSGDNYNERVPSLTFVVAH